MTLEKTEIVSSITYEEFSRMCNIFTRRLLANGLEFYGSRDQKLLAKIKSLLINSKDFKKGFEEQDRGLGSFDKQRREQWMKRIDQS